MTSREMDAFRRTLRANIRAFLLGATLEELYRERRIAWEARDGFREGCIDELIAEYDLDDGDRGATPYHRGF